MNTYIYEITLRAEVEAYSPDDAWEFVQDVFGVGDASGISVTECEYQELPPRNK